MSENVAQKCSLFDMLAVEAHKVVRRRGSHIFLGNWLTDGGEVVSLTRWPPSLPGKFATAYPPWSKEEMKLRSPNLCINMLFVEEIIQIRVEGLPCSTFIL
jgi:hypothetical protein